MLWVVTHAIALRVISSPWYRIVRANIARLAVHISLVSTVRAFGVRTPADVKVVACRSLSQTIVAISGVSSLAIHLLVVSTT